MASDRTTGADVAPLWVNDAAVATLLGVHRSTVWRWLDAGLIPAPRRVGGRTLWCHAEVELFARCRTPAEFERHRRELLKTPPRRP